ncbi:hypothetical protein IIB34_02100 [PVC group bacterium]|nr:hypothetical protein [PVC group bacterium]
MHIAKEIKSYKKIKKCYCSKTGINGKYTLENVMYFRQFGGQPNRIKDIPMYKGEYSYIAKSDFLEGIDYLKSFNCSYDREKVKEIYDIGEKFLKGKEDNYKELRSIYSSRYFVHCCRLMDCLIKIRCWTSDDMGFKAKNEDYLLLKTLWLEMLENWGIDFFQVDFKGFS